MIRRNLRQPFRHIRVGSVSPALSHVTHLMISGIGVKVADIFKKSSREG
jgi:hypothetical protein